MNKKWIKKLMIMARLCTTKHGGKKADYLKKKKIFKEFGDNNFWYPRVLPADPEMIKIHNNVKIATDVYFCTHDVLHIMFNDMPGIEGVKRYSKEIEIFDNSFIGAKSTIMYGVSIGPNAIVAANAVVTKDVPEGMVVGGNPARIIGKFEDVKNKRISFGKE